MMSDKICEVECPRCKAKHTFVIDKLGNYFWLKFCDCDILPFYEIGKEPILIETSFEEIFLDGTTTFVKSRG